MEEQQRQPKRRRLASARAGVAPYEFETSAQCDAHMRAASTAEAQIDFEEAAETERVRKTFDGRRGALAVDVAALRAEFDRLRSEERAADADTRAVAEHAKFTDLSARVDAARRDFNNQRDTAGDDVEYWLSLKTLRGAAAVCSDVCARAASHGEWLANRCGGAPVSAETRATLAKIDYADLKARCAALVLEAARFV